MSLSLREQLLKAGLVSEKQLQAAERDQRKSAPRKNKPPPVPTPQQLAAQRAQAEKTARDLELNRRKEEKAQRKARLAEIRQLVEQHHVPRVETEDYYHFVDGKNVRRVEVTPELRERLIKGDLAIVRSMGRYAFVPGTLVPEIRARLDRAIVHHNVPGQAKDNDDPYKDYAVPDDLMW